MGKGRFGSNELTYSPSSKVAASSLGRKAVETTPAVKGGANEQNTFTSIWTFVPNTPAAS
jgi:hypothetical protein